MFYRLGIDIGETSIGWFILQLDKKLEICDIVDGGVYIFPDGREAKSREPLSVSRRTRAESGVTLIVKITESAVLSVCWKKQESGRTALPNKRSLRRWILLFCGKKR